MKKEEQELKKRMNYRRSGEIKEEEDELKKRRMNNR